MEKFKKFCKKTLAFISIGIVVAFALGLIIMSNRPYVEATYKYSLGNLLTLEVEVEDDEITITSSYLGTTAVVEYDCIIKNGKLLVKEDPTSPTYTEYGTINAYELVLKEPVDETDPSQGYVYTTLECGLTKGLRTFNIVMIVIGAIGLAGSVAYMVYDKKHSETANANNSSEN